MSSHTQLFEDLTPVKLAIDQLKKQLDDTVIGAGNQAYTAALDVYAVAKKPVWPREIGNCRYRARPAFPRQEESSHCVRFLDACQLNTSRAKAIDVAGSSHEILSWLLFPPLRFSPAPKRGRRHSKRGRPC